VKALDELKQRKVLQTAALYFAVAWGATEVLSFLIERIPVFPAWTGTAVAILFVLGFPVTVFLAWMFDLDRHGVRRADPGSGIGKGVIMLSLAGLLVATGALSYLLLPKIESERGWVSQGDLGTVAVLPFENLTGDPSLGYLGAGLAEDIRQRLSLQTDLKVIGRVSMAGFGGAGTDLASVRGLLNAGLVLEGNLQRVAGQLRVNLALLDTASGAQIWGNAFSTEQGGWDPLRQRIVTSLAEQLELTVRVRSGETPIPDSALEAYLRGLATLNDAEVADGWFEEAVRLAPDFADAWARMALLRVEMIWRGKSIQDSWNEAEPMFARARELEPDNLLADIAEASLLWVAKLDPLTSYEVLQRAESRAPNHPLVLAGLSTAFCFILGRQGDSIVYGRRYLAQDPLNPDAHNRLGLAYMFAGKLSEALEQNARAIELDPSFNRAWDYRANWQVYHNLPADALVTLTRRARLEAPVSDVTERCMIYAAGSFLPEERAIPLAQDAVQRGLGMNEAHWWCDNPLEILVSLLLKAGREAEAEEAAARLEEWYRTTGNRPTNEHYFAETIDTSHCEDDLCRLRTEMGEEAFEAWLGPDPPLQYFSFHLAFEIASALIEAGRVEDGQRLAALAAPVARDAASPGDGRTSTPGTTISPMVVALFALAGDIETALAFAEQVGPEAFFQFATRMKDTPGLEGHPRWEAFVRLGQARRDEEVAKIDRLVASGEIVMP
jgi:TolB-like protein